MAVIRICGICESSCPDVHTYKIKNITYHVCETCWGIVRAIARELSNQEKVTKSKSKT